MADLPTQRDFEDFDAWSGRDVLGPRGELLGTVGTIYLDEATGTPEWVLLSRKEGGSAFVPLAGASVEEHAIRVEQSAERIASAPRPDAGETLTIAEKKALYEHYGLEYSKAESETVLPEGPAEDAPAAPADQAPAAEATAAAEAAPVEEPAAAEEAVPAEEPPPAEPAPVAEPAAAPEPAPSAPDMAPRNLSSATASELPPPRPQVVPPTSGFSYEVEESGGPPRPPLPAVLAGAIAGLILILLLRRRRR